MVRKTIVGLITALLLGVSNAYALDDKAERNLHQMIKNAKQFITDANRKCDELHEKAIQDAYVRDRARPGSVDFAKLLNTTAFETKGCCTDKRRDLWGRGIDLLTGASLLGSEDAMIELGDTYSSEGCPGEKNLDESVRWYSRAAYKHGSVKAMEKLGDLYGDPGWPESRKAGNRLEAFNAYAQAANKGSAYGWIRMGQMKKEKSGWDRNDVLNCFLQAAKLDPSEAGLVLGQFYEDEGNYSEAIRAYRMSDTFAGESKARRLEGK